MIIFERAKINKILDYTNKLITSEYSKIIESEVNIKAILIKVAFLINMIKYKIFKLYNII